MQINSLKKMFVDRKFCSLKNVVSSIPKKKVQMPWKHTAALRRKGVFITIYIHHLAQTFSRVECQRFAI